MFFPVFNEITTPTYFGMAIGAPPPAYQPDVQGGWFPVVRQRLLTDRAMVIGSHEVHYQKYETPQ